MGAQGGAASQGAASQFRHPDALYNPEAKSSTRKRKGVGPSRAQRYVSRGGMDLSSKAARASNQYVQEGREREREASSQARSSSWRGAASSGGGGLQPERRRARSFGEVQSPPRERRSEKRHRR
jgi:hypothetical protein